MDITNKCFYSIARIYFITVSAILAFILVTNFFPPKHTHLSHLDYMSLEDLGLEID